MKKQIRHISFLILSTALLVSATVLTYDGWSHELDNNSCQIESSLLLESQIDEHVLDTAQFFLDNTCYEYTQISQSVESFEKTDQLSKTVVKVENKQGKYEAIETASIKSLPLNASLNLMIEKYTVKRHFKNAKPSFFVTVESFNTTIERSNLFDFKIHTDSDIGTFLNNRQLNLIKKFCSGKQIVKKCCNSDRPI